MWKAPLFSILIGYLLYLSDVRHAELKKNAIKLEGVFQAVDTDLFLACDTHRCSIKTVNETYATYFKRETGSEGQYRYKVTRGPWTGLCLNREHCHSGDSNARLYDCNHCGSKHWQFNVDTGKLAEDKYKNCIQNDGGVRHCDRYQQLQIYVPPKAWNKPKGDWQLSEKVLNGKIRQDISWGVISSETNTQSSTWIYSLQQSFASGVNFAESSTTISCGQEIASAMSTTFSTSFQQTCSVECDDKDMPYTFLYQWYTEHSREGSEKDITKATSCFYLCLYGETGEPNPPECPATCCMNENCTKPCNPGCLDN